MTILEGGDPARTRPVWIDEVPPVRTVDQFTGNPPPSELSVDEWWRAGERADRRIEEFDRLARDNEALRARNDALQCRIDELTDGGGLEHENREIGTELLAARSEAARLRRLLEECRGAS